MLTSINQAAIAIKIIPLEKQDCLRHQGDQADYANSAVIFAAYQN